MYEWWWIFNVRNFATLGLTVSAWKFGCFKNWGSVFKDILRTNKQINKQTRKDLNRRLSPDECPGFQPHWVRGWRLAVVNQNCRTRPNSWNNACVIFSARQHIAYMLSALARPSVSLSVCHTGGSVNKKAVLSQRWPRDAHYISRSWRAFGEIWPFEIIQDGGRHLEFVRIENSAIRSAVPENPSLEQNMKWIGRPVAVIWPFEIFPTRRRPQPSWICSNRK